MAEGGNAVDAAVAVEYALAVCYPTAGNIGGGGFMVVRLADGTTDAIDYREKAPSAAHRDMYLDSTGNVIEGLSLDTHLSAGVPGTVDGTLYAHSLYGKNNTTCHRPCCQRLSPHSQSGGLSQQDEGDIHSAQ
jgi:gamma-glutamyltranspeptidase/glutathione hydrolase